MTLWVYCKFKLLGCGDFTINDITDLPDPCPLPEGLKKRTLIEKEKTIYAPMSGVGGIVYDKDAVYIDLGGSHSHSKSKKVPINQSSSSNNANIHRLFFDCPSCI
jgi:ribosome biogenesis protein BMS1